jgi:hypothetical protein
MMARHPHQLCESQYDPGRPVHWQILTNLELSKGPLPPNKPAIRQLLLFLPDTEVNIEIVLLNLTRGHFRAWLVSVAVVLAINIDEHRNARCDPAMCVHVNAERDGLIWDGDKALDGAIAKASLVFLECGVAWLELDRAAYSR